MKDSGRNLPTLLVATVATLLLGPLLTLELFLRIDASNTSLLVTAIFALFVAWVGCKLMRRTKLSAHDRSTFEPGSPR